ncbi:MAG: hypothetical protein IPO40_12755 [Fibrobacteres bacterium]|nr:hypothetical protein [Fibrobacterota bacterium]
MRRLYGILASLVLLAVLLSQAAHAASACLDPSGEWSSECFETRGGQRQVKKAYRRNLRVDRSGFATLTIKSPRELVAVDRRGVVVVSGIYFWGDFDHPNPDGGISRFSVPADSGKRKCGYFNDTTFAVVVPAIWDNCTSFRNGEASACNGCVRYCTEVECQHSVLIGGDSSLTFDAKGNVTGRERPVMLGQACPEGAAPRTWMDGSTMHLKCPSPNAPLMGIGAAEFPLDVR